MPSREDWQRRLGPLYGGAVALVHSTPWRWPLALGDGDEARSPGWIVALRPIVAGFERFYSAPGADLAAGGRLLVGELNCVSCHKGEEAPLAPVTRKQAPILDRVGSRAKVDHLRAFLSDPHAVKPGTTMPDLLAGRDDKAAIVEALVHFLASTGTVRETPPARREIGQGRDLYNQAGCAACHGAVGDKASTALATTVPMGDLPWKYTIGSLATFLLDPLICRPSGRMPGMGLKPSEAQAVSSYLLRDIKVSTPTSLAYRYYEGEWTELPDFDKLAPVASGVADGFDLGLARRRNGYAIRFEGKLEVDRAGNYTFRVASDDGSKLWVDGKLIADNDGIHPTSEKSGRVRLDKGRHEVVVGYFDGAGQAELEVDYEGPGQPRRSLAPEMVPIGAAAPAPARFVVDPDKARNGRTLFASIGCSSCHQLREGDKMVAAREPAGPLAGLKPDAGCLAAEPPKGVPDYDLSPLQRTALAAALRPEGREPTGPEAIARTFLAFNCYACHARDGVGGVEPDRDAAFATTQKEMGEEGRIPPNLGGVGGKLTEVWLKHVLADGAKDRPYMLTRMPKFGERNVGHLAKPLIALDSVAPVPAAHYELPERKVKATGRFLVGSQAFNCGSCHKFKEHEAGGIQALDMTMMTRRLRRDWFHRYVVDPQLYRPGTRMPTAWPGGKTQLEGVLDGDTLKQVESIWQYLSDGPDAATPYGIGRDPMPLVASREAVLYRNFIQGAGSRAIGVGYPEKANIAFDANDLRLAMIWQGAFLDASKHWSGRGVGYEGPLGDNVLKLPPGPGFANLSDLGATWPAKAAKGEGDQFRGYRLASAGKPVFLYDVGPAHVEDFPDAVPGKDAGTIRRTLDITADGPTPHLYFRVASAGTIEILRDGWFAIDGEWKVRIDADDEPIVRIKAGKTELIVPVKIEGGKARIVEEFAW